MIFWPVLMILGGVVAFVLSITALVDWLHMRAWRRRLDGATRQNGKQPPG